MYCPTPKKNMKKGTSGSTSAPQVDGCTLALPDSKVSVSLFYLGKTTITEMEVALLTLAETP